MKSRNALHSEQTNKLMYLYTNAHILNQFKKKLDMSRDLKSKSICSLNKEDEVILEELLLGLEVEG